jgi:two-component system sensor histidine kinase QseC
VDLTKLTQEMVSELVPAALEKKDEIELIMPDHDLIILGYGTSISILVRNLVDNAIRYSPEHSSVRVILEESQGHVVLRVIDNGPGIPEQLRARVFERFYRVIGNKSPGSGLGLSIVRQIADLHQATIALDAVPDGQGLQISVTFPKIDISFA